jgi:hypothetical protein
MAFMLLIGRILGAILLFAAGVVLVRDGLVWLDLHLVAPLSLAGLWSDLAASSLRATHTAIEQRLPWLWTRGLAPILSLWALPVFAALGLLLLWSCRRAPQRRHRY